MTQPKQAAKAWVYILLWSAYIAVVSLYAEYIVSRPMNVWIQGASTVVLLIATFYIFKFSFTPLIKDK